MRAFIIILILLFTAPAYARDIGFRLFKSATSETYEYGEENAVATAPRRATTLTYTNPTAGTWYFVLRAYNNAGESADSNEVTDTFESSEVITFEWDTHGPSNFGVTMSETIMTNIMVQ